jgi:hypothetical protein
VYSLLVSSLSMVFYFIGTISLVVSRNGDQLKNYLLFKHAFYSSVTIECNFYSNRISMAKKLTKAGMENRFYKKQLPDKPFWLFRKGLKCPGPGLRKYPKIITKNK